MSTMSDLIAQVKASALADALLNLALREVHAALDAHAADANKVLATMNTADVNAFIATSLYPRLKDEYTIRKFGHTLVIPGKRVLTPTVLTLVLAYCSNSETQTLDAARAAIKSAYLASLTATATP